MSVRVRLYRPSDLFGRLICWRLESKWSHATLEIDGTIYSATFPKVVAVGLNDPSFGMPPRAGRVFDIRLSDDEKAKALAWFRAQVGTSYDVLSVLGWAFRVQSWQSRTHVFCFESVYAALAVAGVFPVSKLLITGDQLLCDLLASGRVENPDVGQYDQLRARAIASEQRPAVTIKAPTVP